VPKSSFVLVVSFVLTVAAVPAATQPRGVIVEPRPETVIADRRAFPVATSIAGFASPDAQAKEYFWIAQAPGHDHLTRHWPKTAVTSGTFVTELYDNSHNPTTTLQPMTILLLRVDAARNDQYVRWLAEGSRTGIYTALPLVERQIVARVPVYFKQDTAALGTVASSGRTRVSTPSANQNGVAANWPPAFAVPPVSPTDVSALDLAPSSVTVNREALAARNDLIVSMSVPVGNVVPWRVCLVGSVSDANARVHVLIRPLRSNAWYVQPPIWAQLDGTGASFTTMAYIADAGTQFAGERFVAVAVANPRTVLKEGEVLASIPTAEAQSPLIDLVRDDNAQSGCGLLASLRETVAARTIRAIWAPVARAMKRVLVQALALLYLIAFAVRRNRTEAAEKCMDSWIASAVSRLSAAVSWAVSSIVATFNAALPWCRARADAVRASRGCTLTIQAFVTRIAFLCVSAPLLYFGAIADIRTTLLGLGLVFPATEGVDMTPSGLFGDDVALRAFVQFGQGPATSTVSGVAPWLMSPFTTVWNEPLGAFAIGLTAMQAAFGAIVLWGISDERGVSLTLPRLYRDRPVLTSTFVIFVVAVAALAAYRAYELSPAHIPGWVPALIAFLLGTAVPVVLGYALHYMLHSLGDWIATMAWAASVSTIYAFGTGTVASWSLLLLGALAAMGLLVVTAIVVRIVLGIVFWSASLFGEVVEIAIRRMREWRPVDRPRWGAMAVRMTVIVLIVVALSLTSWTIVAAAGQTIANASTEARHDPRRPYTAWVWCVDVSRSVDPAELARMQRVLENLVQSEVAANDLVWLVEISSHTRTAELFEIPLRSKRPTRSTPQSDDVRRVKARLTEAIRQLRAQVSTTNLGEPIQVALGFLASKPGATRRRLVVASDFIQDIGGRKSALPPAIDHTSAMGVSVSLLLTQPTQDYLDTMRITSAELFGIVRDKWVARFRDIGATYVSAQPVDAVPIGSGPSQRIIGPATASPSPKPHR
jgi:hypothetical protein